MAPLARPKPAGAKWYCIPKSNRLREDNPGTLCRTTDSGRHWRPAFDPRAALIPRNTETFLVNFAATSNVDAILSIGWEYSGGPEPEAYGHVDYWTRDGGKHWYRTTALQGFDSLRT